MPFSPETIAMKPYNQCIKCEYLGVKCDGPNVIAMSKERFCEWCRERKEFLGWSNAKVSEVACVSKTTIERIMSGKVAGLNGETISAVTCALVYGYACAEETWGKYPCAMMALERERQTLADPCPECARHILQHQSDREKIDFLKGQIAFKEAQMLTKDEQLKERAAFMRTKDRAIQLLAAAVVVLFLILLAALVTDYMNPNIGFFWREALTAVIG